MHQPLNPSVSVRNAAKPLITAPPQTGSGAMQIKSSALRPGRDAISAFTRVFDALWRIPCGALFRRPGPYQSRTVMAGLDPAIHLLRKTLAKMDGCAGQARA